MFWAYGDFSNLEKICVNSFASKGYRVNLWTYGDISNVPSNIHLRNAREILDEKLVFLNKKGSYASFSDCFRYAVLNREGGLYVDTDVIALVEPSKISKNAFLVTERKPKLDKIGFGILDNSHFQINNNVIYNPAPKKGNIIDQALKYSLDFPRDSIHWGELGPLLLTKLLKENPSHDYEIKEVNYANSIDNWDCPKNLLEPNYQICLDAHFLHCYNEMWKRSGVDKNINFPRMSLMDNFYKKYMY
jgi:mannosyltransferase OCH1-like enzyme